MAAQFSEALQTERQKTLSVTRSLPREGAGSELSSASPRSPVASEDLPGVSGASVTPLQGSASRNQETERPAQDGTDLPDTDLPQPIPLSLESRPIRHQARLHPQMVTPGNFEYLGAFRPPHARIHETTFAYGGWAVAYRADGDPSGADDGTPGSLYIVGHKYD